MKEGGRGREIRWEIVWDRRRPWTREVGAVQGASHWTEWGRVLRCRVVSVSVSAAPGKNRVKVFASSEYEKWGSCDRSKDPIMSGGVIKVSADRQQVCSSCSAKGMCNPGWGMASCCLSKSPLCIWTENTQHQRFGQPKRIMRMVIENQFLLKMFHHFFFFFFYNNGRLVKQRLWWCVYARTIILLPGVYRDFAWMLLYFMCQKTFWNNNWHR